VRTFGAADVNHLNNCPDMGGNKRPHDNVKFTLAHACFETGLAPAVPKAEVPLWIPGFGWWNADLCFTADGIVRRFVVDVSVVNLDSATSRRRTGSSFADVELALRQRETEKRRLPVARWIDNEQGSITTFVPFVMSSSGAFGPAARDFLKVLYKSARERGRWRMSDTPHLKASWATQFASSYWDMRLSMACSVTSAEVVGRLIVRDGNLNMTTNGRQAHPDPNVTGFGRRPVSRMAPGATPV
jgi:hypothetical protein